MGIFDGSVHICRFGSVFGGRIISVAGAENADYIELECPHYTQDYKYQDIAEKIKLFLTEEKENL